MSEMVLPGTYIEVRPEGLIVPGRVSVNTVGVVGTAGKGPVDERVILSSYTEAREVFGSYDAWDEDLHTAGSLLTLTRALEMAFNFGATTVQAVRVANGAAKANFLLKSALGDCVTLEAKTEGEWGNNIEVNVTAAVAGENSFVSNEKHPGGAAISLTYSPILQSARNRVSVFNGLTRRTTNFNIIYGAAPAPGQVSIDLTNGDLAFAAGEEPANASDELTASYTVSHLASSKVTLTYELIEENYIVASGNDLIADLKKDSALVDGTDETKSAELPAPLAGGAELFGSGTNQRGANGATGANYQDGLDALINENVHIIVAAGQSHEAFGAELTNHCKLASSEDYRRERIGVVGSELEDSLDTLIGHELNSDRMVFVAPGIAVRDAELREEVILPGSYAAAAVAGLMASYSPHVSLTNKPIAVRGLEERYTNAELKQLVQARVVALQEKLGFKVTMGITTSTNTAWKQITTRRIVDYAKFGVRSAADPYIGLLNNERVRGALRATINSFLAEMVEDEMLISYELDVAATREEERKGIARVTIVLRPVFSIDFIKVTMFLE